MELILPENCWILKQKPGEFILMSLASRLIVLAILLH